MAQTSAASEGQAWAPLYRLIAIACALAGVVVYFAANQAFAMLSLSTQYAATTTCPLAHD